VHKVLEKLYVDASSAIDNLKGCRKPEGEDSQELDLIARSAQIFTQARITSTESFFVETLTVCRPEKIQSRLQKRVDQMKDNGISETDIKPAIWKKVQMHK
jgi:hypothetical protein